MSLVHSRAVIPLQQIPICQLVWLCFVKKRLAAAKAETSHADVAHMHSGDRREKTIMGVCMDVICNNDQYKTPISGFNKIRGIFLYARHLLYLPPFSSSVSSPSSWSFIWGLALQLRTARTKKAVSNDIKIQHLVFGKVY